MCRTVHAVLQTVICGIQMLVRVFMTAILMLENVIRMLLQTLYNFISFLLQMISLVPICLVFLLTARLKCFMCGGGGPCPVNRGGTCDCLMSLLAIIILFFIFRATGVLDKIFYSIGYAKAPTKVARFVPTPGDITECSRNDSEDLTMYYFYDTSTDMYYFSSTDYTDMDMSTGGQQELYNDLTDPTITGPVGSRKTKGSVLKNDTTSSGFMNNTISTESTTNTESFPEFRAENKNDTRKLGEWTTVVYYLV